MIFRVSIGELTTLLDDEITDERPTPEVAADYLHRCATEVLRVYTDLPAEALLEPGAED
ncbi:MAG: hypothetical protein ACXVX9_00125 [Mycobacteriaceae bacterium]